jgi:dTDP-4-amino-4,6-dideoxygalactose transaminase
MNFMPDSIPVPFLDLKAQYRTIKREIDRAVFSVLENQSFILGPNVRECEAQIAEYCQCPHGIGVTSGSDALLISLMAEGVGPGDDVITTPFTFFATVGAILRVGATPVFVDICPHTFNLDVRQIPDKVTPRTRAILPVHLFGQCAEMQPLMEIAQQHSLAIIEDAAQAIGSEYDGHRAGSFGHYGCFSFYPSKNLGGGGDGGLVVTRDDQRATRLRTLRSHGAKPKYYHSLIGGNFRLDALQAAIVTAKLPYLDAWIERRRENAQRYREMFHRAGIVGAGRVQLPLELSDRRHVYNQFVIRTPNRDQLCQFLNDRSIGNEIYYPVPLHLQKCLAYLGYQKGDFPECERAVSQALALPIFPELSVRQQQIVADAVTEFFTSWNASEGYVVEN